MADGLSGQTGDFDGHGLSARRGAVVDALEGRDVGVVAAAGDDYVTLPDRGAAGQIARLPLPRPVLHPGVCSPPPDAPTTASARSATSSPRLRENVLTELVTATSAWDRMDLSRQRAIIKNLMTITLHTPGRGARRDFDPAPSFRMAPVRPD